MPPTHPDDSEPSLGDSQIVLVCADGDEPGDGRLLAARSVDGDFEFAIDPSRPASQRLLRAGRVWVSRDPAEPPTCFRFVARSLEDACGLVTIRITPAVTR